MISSPVTCFVAVPETTFLLLSDGGNLERGVNASPTSFGAGSFIAPLRVGTTVCTYGV